jgi:uncharacterized membrane protein HdeD (DUF308 family)
MLAVPFLLTLALAAGFALLPVFTFLSWRGVLLVPTLVALGFCVASIVMTWRASDVRTLELPWWARWYSLGAIAIGCLVAYWPTPDILEAMILDGSASR